MSKQLVNCDKPFIRADYHVHTEFSDDSAEPMEQVILSAISKGLQEICFTDHVDYAIKLDHEQYMALSPDERENFKQNVDYPVYFKRIAELQNQFQGQITIKRGLEFGVQVHTIKQFTRLFEAYPMDFVILSCHQVEDKEFWTGEFQRGRRPEEYNARYYQEILDCAKAFKDYSVLGHLDMIQRYNDSRYPFEASQEIITEILKTIIADGKGIEINTSSFHYGLDDLMPARDILALYKSLGGEIITTGSDAHTANYVGDHFGDVYEVLRDMDYKYICTFDNMLPIFHRL